MGDASALVSLGRSGAPKGRRCGTVSSLVRCCWLLVFVQSATLSTSLVTRLWPEAWASCHDVAIVIADGNLQYDTDHTRTV